MENMNFVYPCLCIGSVGSVHYSCIKKWIEKQLELNKKKNPICEICLHEISYK
jgi:E3 ubiquitin-protein ligase DOA10